MKNCWMLPGLLLLGACTYEVDWRDRDDAAAETDPPPPSSPGAGVVVVRDEPDSAVDRGKELFVTDPRIVSAARFDFAHLMDLLAGDPARTPAFVEAWLLGFTSTRPGIEAALLAPWRAQATCSYGETCALPMSRAPFRLIAIVNRADLAPAACAPGGELRFVYNALDPRTGAPLEATVAIEVPLPATRTAADVARAWRALGALDLDATYLEALGLLADDALTNVAAAHVRTDEVAFASVSDPTWELRDFVLQAGALVPAPLEATPDAALDGTATLGSWVLANPGAALPAALQGTVARTLSRSFGWTLAGASPSVRQAFSAKTCSGCHGGDRLVQGNPVIADRLPFQHVAATGAGYDAEGETVMSTYLSADRPQDPDELARRASVLQALAATPCTPTGSPGSY